MWGPGRGAPHVARTRAVPEWGGLEGRGALCIRGARVGRELLGILVLVAAVTVAGVLVCAPGALAMAGRGHVFSETFEGSGEHALVDPTGVAVDEAVGEGEVYVVDRHAGDEGVERFRPAGGGGYEFVSVFKVRSPEDIAVDNSTSESDPSRGDVYVVGAEAEGASPQEHDVLYKYDPVSGKVIWKRTIFHTGKEELELEGIDGVGVDASGTLWVYWGEEGVISGFSDGEANKWQPSLTREPHIEAQFECRARPGFAVAAGGEDFYVAHERENTLEECPGEESSPALVAEVNAAGQVVAAGLDHEATSGVAVDQAEGAVYADNVDSVAAFSAGGGLIQRFGAGQLSGGGSVAVDAALGEVLVAEPEEGKVAVFAGAGAGAPAVDATYAQALTPSSERLSALVDPNGAASSYYFQYGTVSCVGDAAACTDVPSLPGAEIAAGFGDRIVSQEVQGLAPDTTYYYRVLVRNEHGGVEGAQSAETFFTTLPSAEGTLLDGREWELVSPPEKHGATVEPISREGAMIDASADGDALAWAAGAPVEGEPEGNRRPEPDQVISTRSASGWSSRDITTPHDRGEGYPPGAPSEYRAFSPELSFGLVAAPGFQPAAGKPAAGARGQRKDDLPPQRRQR